MNDTSLLKKILHDGAFIVFGSALFALGLDCFEVPNGLAAGGITGISTITHALFGFPVGVQVIMANLLLFGLIARSGNRGYLIRTIAGVVISGLFTDAFAAYVPHPAGDDLLLAALWGGVLCGAGIGFIFRVGGTTGGADVTAKYLARRTGLSLGTVSIIQDAIVVAMSIPVFSLKNALYAVVALIVSGNVCDMVIDGPRSERAAYIISNEHEKIAQEILYTLNRGCTRLEATGLWSGEERPVLFCVLGRSEAASLKEIVADCDPHAIVIISEVYEAFGEGFKQIDF